MRVVPMVFTSVLLLILPWPLLSVGLVAGIDANHHARLMRRLTTGASGFALACAVLASVTYALGMTRSVLWPALRLPAGLGSLGISVNVNVLTVLTALLVAFVGVIVARYSSAHMDGDAHEGRFHRWLSLTLGSFFMLILADDLWGFFIFWVATSLSLHELLAFYRDRPGAVLAARKKYLLHRIADASLFAAFVLIVRALHTSQFTGIASALAAVHGPLPETLQVASGLIVVSAVLKSAQFPSHGWLIQVMEAPTPVSALMHAGIIYTGAFLLLRVATLVTRVNWASDTLVLVGLFSLAATSLMMMTATNIKGSLAYSTSAQMGFMLMECGLGLYSLAALHMVSHAVYKAHAFLSSGSVVDHFRAPALSAELRSASGWSVMWSFAIATPIVIGIEAVFGTPSPQQPALIIMGIILMVALSQLLLQALNMSESGRGVMLLVMVVLSTLVSATYFGLDKCMSALLGADLPAAKGFAGAVQDWFLGLIVAVFVGLLLVQQMLPRIMHKPFWQTGYVHLYNGLYIDMVFTRLVRSFGRIGAVGPLRTAGEGQSREVVS